MTGVQTCALPISVVKHFQIDKANDKITNMMTLAKMLPFTDGSAQADELQRALLG